MKYDTVLTGKFCFGQWLFSRQRRWSLSMSGFLALAFIFSRPLPGFAQSSIAASLPTQATRCSWRDGRGVQSCAHRKKCAPVTTDENGRFQVVDLRPGVYSVTFTLAGFKSVVREGLNLPATFTATVNAQMSVGGVEGNDYGHGESPIVDVQRTRRWHHVLEGSDGRDPDDPHATSYAVFIPLCSPTSSTAPRPAPPSTVSSCTAASSSRR
jgi:hypothetical protein